jgi:hypothetical protein
MNVLSILALVACSPRDEWPPLDLTERLPSGEARAGVVTDEHALFGGISAEGRAGDLKIYNDRVQFVIQGLRDGDYYVVQGGAVIDADIVRPDGQPGRDAVDEWAGMYGAGRLIDPDAVTVVNSGALGGPAIIHAEGHESVMRLLTGALEAPDLVPDLGLDLAVDYVLDPDSWLLEVRSTLTATDQDVTLQPADVLMAGLEVVDPWDPGVGLEAPAAQKAWSGFVGKQNDLALAIVAEPGSQMAPSSLDMLSSVVQLAVGSGPTMTIPAGSSQTFTRYYGVAPDLAHISDEIQARAGTATEPVTGTVTAPDGPVAGARVNVMVDGAPFTLAFSGDDGTFSAQVPAGASTSLLAVGRGQGRFLDLPDGAAPTSPYAAAPVQEAMLASLRNGAIPVPMAEGRGVASADDPLVLGEPGTLIVRSGDDRPFEARVGFIGEDPAVDPRLVPERPNDRAAIGWARDGEVRLTMEPGTYHLVAWRGITAGIDEQDVTVRAGEETVADVSMPAAYTHPGWLLGDPHEHASPSGDVQIPMEDRLTVAAAVGLQMHFGTDHDHIADYRPLLAPLGLETFLASVVADEVSPVMRGHLNVYPVRLLPGEANHGAWSWWSDLVPDTETEFARLRERHGDFVLQSNHPTSGGLADSAAWSPGTIGKPSYWATGFDAVEVENAGHTGDYLAFWTDCTNRGIVSTPTGVSDSHSYTDHAFGITATFFGMGTDDPQAYTDDALVEAVRAGRTIVTRGPFLDLSVAPGSTVAAGTAVDAAALAPDWIHVDRLVLIQDGERVQVVDGNTARFTLDPDRDAWFTIVAEGDAAMAPISGDTPWAMSAPIRVDVDGNGWEAPAAPFVLGD